MSTSLSGRVSISLFKGLLKKGISSSSSTLSELSPGDLIYVNRPFKGSELAVLLEKNHAGNRKNIQFTSITSNGHLIHHRVFDVSLIASNWAPTTASAPKQEPSTTAAPKQNRIEKNENTRDGNFKDTAKATAKETLSKTVSSNPILPLSTRNLLVSKNIDESILSQLARTRSIAEKINQNYQNRIRALHARLLKKDSLDAGKECYSLVDLARLILSVNAPSPAELYATYRILQNERYFILIRKDAGQLEYTLRNLDESNLLWRMITTNVTADPQRASFLKKAESIIRAYRNGEKIKVEFDESDLKYIHLIIRALVDRTPSESIHTQAVYNGIMLQRQMNRFYGSKTHLSNIALFLKEIGVFLKHQDPALYDRFFNVVDDAVESVAQQLGNELLAHSTKDTKSGRKTCISSFGPIFEKNIVSQIMKASVPYFPPLDQSPKDPLEKLRQQVNETVFIIDSQDAHELDDGISFKVDHLGNEWITIHIADPTSYIHPSHPISQIAQYRSTSIYFPHSHLPMIPSSLSRQMMSLGVSPNGLSFSARLGGDGEIVDYKVEPCRVAKTCIVSYDQVNCVLSRTPEMGNVEKRAEWVKQSIKSQDQVIARTKKEYDIDLLFGKEEKKSLEKLYETVQRHLSLRVKQGAIMSDQVQYEIKVESDGDLVGPCIPKHSFQANPLMKSTSTIKINPFASYSRSAAHFLVSESMIIAGRIASKYCQDHKLPVFFRGQVTPLEHAKQEEYHEDIPAIKELLDGRPLESVNFFDDALHEKLISFMAPGQLSSTPASHWAMGITSSTPMSGYVKVTSPLRRYQDMLAHYQIQSALTGNPLFFSPESTLSMMKRTEKIEKMVKRQQRKSLRYWMLEYIRRMCHLCRGEINATSWIESCPDPGTMYPYHRKEGSNVVHLDGIVQSHGGRNQVFVMVPYLGGFRSRASCKNVDFLPQVGQRVKMVVEFVDPDLGSILFSVVGQ